MLGERRASEHDSAAMYGGQRRAQQGILVHTAPYNIVGSKAVAAGGSLLEAHAPPC